MANVKKGQTVRATEWLKHLRWAKRVFWKRQRADDRRRIYRESHHGQATELDR